MKKKTLDFLAFFFSIFLSPAALIPIFLLYLGYFYLENLKQFFLPLLICFIFNLFLPAFLLLFRFSQKKILDLDLLQKENRIFLFKAGFLSSIIGLFILLYLRAPLAILALVSSYTLIALALFLITPFWRISLHSAFFSASLSVLIILFNLKFAYLFFLWPFLAWARLHRKRHNFLQVLFGAFLGIFISFLIFYLFGYRIGEK